MARNKHQVLKDFVSSLKITYKVSGVLIMFIRILLMSGRGMV